jgi:hypothetical protein
LLCAVHILSGDLILHKRTLAPIKAVIYRLRRYDADFVASFHDGPGKVEGYMTHKAKIYLVRGFFFRRGGFDSSIAVGCARPHGIHLDELGNVRWNFGKSHSVYLQRERSSCSCGKGHSLNVTLYLALDDFERDERYHVRSLFILIVLSQSSQLRFSQAIVDSSYHCHITLDSPNGIFCEDLSHAHKLARPDATLTGNEL